MSKVFIGVGHGGSDAGAVGNGLKEKEVNLSIALHLREELQRLIAAARCDSWNQSNSG